MQSDSARVIYQNNPLVEVTCAVEFDPRLELEDSPAAFQNAIRKGFPLYERRRDENEVIHLFFSASGTERVLLSRDTLAYSTSSYERWELFSPVWSELVEAVLSDYGISSFSSMYLRYVDIIDRDDLGLEGHGWTELLNPPYSGLAPDHDVSSWRHQTELSFENGCRAFLEFGSVDVDGEETSNRFIMDVIHVHQGPFHHTERGHVQTALREHTSRIFNDALTSTTKQALRPKEIGGVE